MTDDRRARIATHGRERILPPERGEPDLLAVPTETGLKFLYLPCGAEYPEELVRVRP